MSRLFSHLAAASLALAIAAAFSGCGATHLEPGLPGFGEPGRGTEDSTSPSVGTAVDLPRTTPLPSSGGVAGSVPWPSPAGHAAVGGGAAGSGGYAGGIGWGIAGGPPPIVDQGCPAAVPTPGTPCNTSQSCTYRRGGVCGPNPDLLRACFNGTWGAIAYGIACPGTYPVDTDAGTD